MTDYLTTDTELTSIASAIRSKGGTSAALVYPSGFISAIQEIQTVGTYQSKVVSPTESQQVVSPDSGYDALSSVTVNAISSKYIGTGVVTKAAESYGLSGSTRTIPSGTYLTGDQTILPFRYSGISDQTIKYGTVVKVGDSEDDDRMISITGGFTGANYVSTGQTAAKSSQILEGYSAWVNGNEVKGNITTKAVASYTPSASTQTIPSGVYLTGTQTIAGDSNLISENIAAGTSIFGVVGTHYGGATYTCTIIESNSSYNVASIEYNGTYYRTQGDTFTYHAGENAQLRASGRVSNAYIYVDNILVAEATDAANYVYTLPPHDIEIILYVGSYGSTKVNFPTVTITENGVHAVDSYYYADVSVYPSLQSKTEIIPTEFSQIIAADSSYYGLSSVQINAISSNYVGSNIPSRTAANLSASGSVVIVPSGYYAVVASKAVTAGSVTINSPTITANPIVTLNSSTGVVTATVNNNTSIGAALVSGYISTYTSGTAQVNGSKTLQLTTKSATTYTPSSMTQTIASGQYLTGVQTIAGDSNLVAANIASGVTVFGITGTYTGETYVAMTTQEIWEATASGWGSTNPSVAAAIWNSVAAGWSISATMTDSTIHTSVASGWR